MGTSGDIYALGVLLYEMLTGQVPFDGPDARTVCMKQVQEDVPLPSHLNPAISRAIEQVLLCALAKDPALRYDTAQIFASAYYKSCLSLPRCSNTSRRSSFGDEKTIHCSLCSLQHHPFGR